MSSGENLSSLVKYEESLLEVIKLTSGSKSEKSQVSDILNLQLENILSRKTVTVSSATTDIKTNSFYLSGRESL